MMRHPATAVGTISGRCPLSSTSIIDVSAKATPVALDVTEDCKLGNKWIMGTTSDTAGKMQPVKVSANQISHNFDKLEYEGKQVKKILSNDTAIPLHGDDPLHVISLPSAILVSYAHGMQSGKVSNKDLRFDSEAYHPLMGLCADMLAYHLSIATGLSGLM
eukprot:8278330-Ditylum_brightwellii.AAC.1